MNVIDVSYVKCFLPIFSVNINDKKEELNLAREAIYEEREKNPVPLNSYVKATYTSSYLSHLSNFKFKPLINIALSLCREISKKHFDINIDLECVNCWGMLYNKDDYADPHTHFPSIFSAVVYIDIEKDSAPLIFEDESTFVPENGSLVVFPGIVKHLVPKSEGCRTVVSMNFELKK